MSKDPSAATPPVMSRRTVFVGAGVAGAVGALAAVTAVSKPAPAAPASAGPVAESTGGYQLTDHVKRYYATARV